MHNYYNIFKINMKRKLNVLKETANLTSLSAEERTGASSLKTNLKLFPRTYIDAPYSLGRSIRGLSFNERLNYDPTGSMIKGVVDGCDYDFLMEQLNVHYRLQSKMNCSDMTNLPNNEILCEYPAWALAMPWEKISIYDKFNDYPNMLFRSRQKHNLESLVDKSEEIIKIISSGEGARSQISQTMDLFKSIKKHGLLLSSNPPMVLILWNGSTWRWLMSGDGNHRAYLGFFMGMKVLRVDILAWIKRDDVKNWYNVKNGIYSEQEALQIFDKFFNGSNCLRGDI